MTTRAPLDSFESALLSELRDVVTERAAAQPRRRKPVLVAVAAAATVAASVGAVVFGLGTGGPATAAAYSVSTQDDGDVVVKIRRLEDEEGLERALREHGVKADVTYDPNMVEVRKLPDGTIVYKFKGDGDPSGEGQGGQAEEQEVPSGGASSQAQPPKAGEPTPDDFPDPCGFNEMPPLGAEKVGDEYVFTIPGDAVMKDHELEIVTDTTDGNDIGLTIGFQVGDTHCGMAQI